MQKVGDFHPVGFLHTFQSSTITQLGQQRGLSISKCKGGTCDGGAGGKVVVPSFQPTRSHNADRLAAKL